MPENTNVKIKEIAHSVDSCGTLPVPLRDDMAFRHPELVSGSHKEIAQQVRDDIVTSHPERSEGSQKHSLSRRERPLSGEGRGEGATLQSSEVNALPKFETNLTTQRLIVLSTFQKAAFTLAEVLITLAIIGVVAALTIPNLIQNHNEKAWATASSVFEKKLEVAAKQMNTEEKLSGYSTTKDFVNELKKYIKITKICDSNEITKCFTDKVIWGSDPEPVDMSKIVSAKNFGQNDWNTETIGVRFANGVEAVIAYNPAANQDPYNNQFAATAASMAILYDVSADKEPNTSTKDIRSINVNSLGSRNCILEIGDLCISQIIAPGSYQPMPKSECNDEVKNQLGLQKCYDGSADLDYYGGAVKACGHKSKLPSMSQIGELAAYLYNYSGTIGPSGDISGLSLDTTKAAMFISANGGKLPFYIWSSEERGNHATYRRFFSDKTDYINIAFGTRGLRSETDKTVICLGE